MRLGCSFQFPLKMKRFGLLWLLFFLASCGNDDFEPVSNLEIPLEIPLGFPDFNAAVSSNKPTKYGVALGEKLFNDKRLSTDNSISCASCHRRENAFADNNKQGVGVAGRIGLRNVPPIQNLAFMKFYNWDGSKLQLERQIMVPIITHEEMDSSLLEVIGKIENDTDYQDLFVKAFGEGEITQEKIFKSLAQYQYTLVSANSKYDKQNKGENFTVDEAKGHEIFQRKCAGCHSGSLFTDQSFRNIGFQINPSTEEAGRARVTGNMDDYMSFRVPSLRNVEYTAPYGSFGQFATLKDLLDYFDSGVLESENLDPIFKNNGNRIPLSEQEKEELIAFMKTLSDKAYIGN